MFRILSLLVLVSLLFACTDLVEPSSRGIDTGELVDPVRLEVYLSETSVDRTCENILTLAAPQQDLRPSLIYNSLAEFKTRGFAAIRVDHVPASKKMLVLVLAIDPQSGEIIAKSCADNIETQKGSMRDVHLVLSSKSARGDK